MSESQIKWIGLPDSLVREFADPIERLGELSASGQACMVKSNPQRTVYRAHLVGLDLHVKMCRVTGWRDWLRERLRPAKARLEYDNLISARQHGLDAIHAIGCGVPAVRGAGPSFLITLTAADAVPLDRWLEANGESLDARRRQQLASSLGHFIARVHVAGFVHPDLHPGNILIQWGSDKLEFTLVDLHDVAHRRTTSNREITRNLAIFNRWFILRTHRSDRLRFWRAYKLRNGLCKIQPTKVEATTRRLNDELWRSRSTRCLGTNRRFLRVDGNNFVRDWLPTEIHALGNCSGLLDEHSGCAILKSSSRSVVGVREIQIGGVWKRVVIKRIKTRSVIASLTNLLRADASLRSWRNGHGMLDCLLPTPRPLALIRHRRFGLVRKSTLITEYIPNARDLRSALLDPNEQPKKQRRIELVARLVRHLHECGWSHRDLKAINILLAPDLDGREKAWLIDLPGASRPRRLTRLRKIKNIARLNAAFHSFSNLTRTDRLRFLRIYLNWNLHGRGDWKIWWKQIARRSKQKVERNLRRNRPLA